MIEFHLCIYLIQQSYGTYLLPKLKCPDNAKQDQQ
ncbi:Uncharacterised protein [uncultured Comamonas sp.]|nr:Uncharacterised protein [uncultured Comamonas sp.]